MIGIGMFGSDDGMRVTTLRCMLLRPFLFEATSLPAGGRRRRVKHDTLEDGDEIELGNTVVRALATPGHAPVQLVEGVTR